MNIAFDHIVHYVEDPEKTVETLNNNGIEVYSGGHHKNRPTFNFLSYFGMSYIEYLSITDKDKLERMFHSDFSMINTIITNEYVEGFSRFVFRTDNINGVAEELSKNGVQIEGPFDLSRLTPEGSLLEWKLLFLGDNENELELPYIIEWKDSDDKRKKNIIKKNLDSKFSHINIAVRNLENTVEKWSQLFNLEVSKKFYDMELKAQCQKLKLNGGDLIFCSPIKEGLVSDVLSSRGESPFQVSVIKDCKEKNFKLLGGYYQILNK